MHDQEDITQLLEAAAGGDRRALDQLFPLVYDELRRMARGRLQRERPDHTFGTAGLVHEAYLKLIKLDRVDWKSRAHFFAMAAQAMRNILVDYARERKAQKRGGGYRKVSMDDAFLLTEDQVEDVLTLEQALKQLEQYDARLGQVVACRFFGELTIDETAEVLGVSPATVSRDWSLARAWLNKTLAERTSGER